MNKKKKEITITRPTGERRLDVLSPYTGIHMALRIEAAVHDALWHLSRDYQGGPWDYFELSNGGVFLAPQNRGQTFRIKVSGNSFSAAVDPHVAGLIATLFAYNQLAWIPTPPRAAMLEKEAQLSEYIETLPNAALIKAAIE